YDTTYFAGSHEYLFAKNDSLRILSFNDNGRSNIAYDTASAYSERNNHSFNVLKTDTGAFYFSIPNSFIDRSIYIKGKKIPGTFYNGEPVLRNVMMVTYPLPAFVLLSDSGKFYDIPKTHLVDFERATHAGIYIGKSKKDHPMTIERVDNYFVENKNTYLVTNK